MLDAEEIPILMVVLNLVIYCKKDAGMKSNHMKAQNKFIANLLKQYRSFDGEGDYHVVG